MPRRCIGALVFLVLGLQFGFAQTIQVLGVNDRSDNIDAVSFIVPTDPGFSYQVLLDSKQVPAGVTNRVTKVDYHEILVLRTNAATQAVATRLVRFVIMSSNRLTPERGLIEWTPYPLIPSADGEFAGATLQLMTPANYPAGMDIPVVARVAKASGDAQRVNGTVTSGGHPPFRILRGHGSGFLSPGLAGNTTEYSAQLGPLSGYKEVQIDASTAWTSVSGIFTTDTNWPVNSRIHITGNLTIPTGTTLTIGAGSIIRINPLVNITNSGRTIIDGTVNQPVVFTSTNAAAVLPEVRTYAWGGFFIRGAGAELIANACMFVGGGGNTGISFSPGSSHKSEQAVFLVHSSARMALTNCAVINTAGQVANGYNSDLTYDHCHIQRAITAGESVGGTIIFNHCAVIEFPEDNGFNNAALADGDYDAIYFTTGTHLVLNSLIGFCKDDAIDSGSGGGGTVLVTNCWIESALHEANAWSNDSGLRDAQTYDSVLMNSGQGFECGWSGPVGSPQCYASNILSIGNSIGARFGDNYDTIGPYNGILRVTNSFVLYNYRDVWGMTWRNDSTGWYYRSNQMDIRSNYLSQANTFHPSNTIWNGLQHGSRLARFMSTPANAAVGAGIATWTNTIPVSSLWDGIPIRLSSFTTNPVTVAYSFENGVLVTPRSVTFAPGETVKRVFPYDWDFSTFQIPQLFSIAPGEGSEITGADSISLTGSIAAPALRNIYPANSQLDHARLNEAFPVGLTVPSGVPLSFAYQYDWSGGILRTGVVSFAPGETLAWASAPGGDLSGIDIVRFKLLNPPGAPYLAYFVKSPSTPTPPPATVISMGAVWKYPNVLGFPGATWRDLTFNDASWLSGPAQLGFSNNEENDEATLITNFGPQGQVTYYFRRVFNVADANAFTNLSMTLLRDDAGVVHLNGREAYRSPNLPGGTITHTTTSIAPNGENTIDRATLAATNLVSGQNIAAVEIHQQAASSSDISFDFELMGNPVPPPPAPQHVYFGQFDGQLAIAWGDPTFILEQADALTGPWTPAATTSPYLTTPNRLILSRFFRLKR